MSQHKGASVGGVALLLVLAAVTIAPAFLPSSAGGALNDSSSCSAWASARPAEQSAYSELYLKEHADLPDGAILPRSVMSAITNACSHAAYLGEADDMSVIAALRHEY
ncbi:MAG: hypothetical protein ABI323_11835 [Solirubrobacteraceae bacterium]